MQQINLYVPELRPKREWLSASSLAIVVLSFIGLMLISVLMNVVQLKSYEQQVIRLENQRVASSQQVADIKSRTPIDTAGKLDAKIASLRTRVHQRIQISDLIGTQNLGNRDGYAARFNDLAKNVSNDIALTRFKFSDGGKQVALLGESRQAASIATMIAEIKAQPSFADSSFGALTIRDNKAISKRVYFAFGFDPLFNPDDMLAGGDQ